MENVNKLDTREIYDTRAKLEAIHQDIKRLIEKSNQDYLNIMLNNMKEDIIDSITTYITEDIQGTLERNMVDPCNMRETCKSRFSKFLEDNAELIKETNVTKETIEKKKQELNDIKETAPYDKCEACFSEVKSLFDKQLNLIGSMEIYNDDNPENKMKIASIPEETMVKTVLEPISNKQRLQILKSMASETKTFTALSELTGLRGGNLLFHIQKLMENSLIIQRHERGDYMITKKGYNLLVMLYNFKKYLD